MAISSDSLSQLMMDLLSTFLCVMQQVGTSTLTMRLLGFVT